MFSVIDDEKGDSACHSYLGLLNDIGKLSHPGNDFVWSDQDVAVSAVYGFSWRLH